MPSKNGQAGAGWLTWLVTADHFPGFSARVRRIVLSPLGFLSLAACLSLALGLLLHPRVLTLFATIAAVATLGVMIPWVSAAGLGGSLRFSRHRVTEGEAVTAELTLTNRLPWPLWGLSVSDRTANTEPQPEVKLSAAPGRSQSTQCWAFTPPCRGGYPAGRPAVVTGFPFGLWHVESAITVGRSLVVWPRTYPVGPPPLSDGEEQVEGNVSRNKVGSSGEVLGVRPYRRGDLPRRIHWPQSAKRDQLIVCELQSNARPVIQIVLDLHPKVHAGVGPDSTLEWAVRVAASMASGWLEAGAMVGLALSGKDIPATGGSAQRTRILDTLALAAPAPGHPLADVLALPNCRSFRDGVQVIITTDRGMTGSPRGSDPDGRRRWVVLACVGFTDGGGPAAVSLPAAWLTLDSPHSVPERLRSGWREAVHGS